MSSLQERYQLLTYGYFRQKIESVFSIRIPSEIQDLCLLYRGKRLMDETKILTAEEQNTLFDLVSKQILSCNIDKLFIELKLLYRWSRDGHAGREFHNRCDNKGATLTLIHTEFDHVCGGYATVDWQSSGEYKADPTSFIFLLRSQFGHKPKIFTKQHNPQWIVYHNPNYGPTFGNGHD
eukprot:293737_1